MQVLNDLMAKFSDVAEHGSIETKVLGQTLMALAGAGIAIPGVKAIIDAAKRKLPRAFKAAEQGAKKEAEPEL